MPQNPLLAPLFLARDHTSGYCFIQLTTYEHRDYIEDVLAEHFGLPPTSSDLEMHRLYFDPAMPISQVQHAIDLINRFHSETGRLYETV
jgi:hypothetical protein